MTHYKKIGLTEFSGGPRLRECALPRQAVFGLSDGVTLIELLMVMVLMAIIVSISVPAFSGMGRGAAMRGAVTAVRNTLSHSRQRAITHREQVTFCYTSTNYFVTNLSGMIQDTNALPASVSFKDSPDQVTFKPDGGLTVGSVSVKISLVASNDNTKTITINGLTGTISVE